MRSALCLPIQKTTWNDVLATISQHQQEYQAFEVWLECLRPAEREQAAIVALAQELQDKLVIVFRRPQLEPMTIPLAERLQLLRALTGAKTYVDLDIGSQTAELAMLTAEALTLQTIVSYHNYQQTPAEAVLQQLVTAMRAHHPAVVKLATFCQNEQDALRLLHLLIELRSANQPAIVLGMGPHGLATRIFGALWGNVLAFAPPAQQEQSAPGQLTRQQLQTILQIIQGA